MTSVCLYFQVHQPFRLRPYAVNDRDPFYFENEANRVIMEKVANKCYRPATKRILDLVRRHEGRFRVSYAITLTALDQMQEWCPDVIDLFRALADTGCCEFVGETSHHSLSFIFARGEFDAQVDLHDARMRALFGATPTVFRNTELIYCDDLARHLATRRAAPSETRDGADRIENGGPGGARYRAVLCEGLDRILGYRSPNYVYAPPGTAPGDAPVRLLLKNYRLSDDIAFRFSDRGWPEWPLTADRFASWVNQINGDGHLCNLFMDYETLGEHQWSDTGIFAFLEAMPDEIMKANPGHNDFVTPAEAVAAHAPVGTYDVPDPISWADTERDLSAWLGNGMQQHAARVLYELEGPVKAAHAAGDEHVLEDWRKLTTSDHLYYMSTKHLSDREVHDYFSPYEGPYEAYINFMNVMDDMRRRVRA